MDSIVEKIGYDVEMGMDLLWVEGEYKKEELIKYLDWCRVEDIKFYEGDEENNNEMILSKYGYSDLVGE